nr:ranBP2-type zinc finger protein At1g67325-like [Ipomoea batatas]
MIYFGSIKPAQFSLFFSLYLCITDGTRDNDWKCPKCGNVNFSFRTVCNMRKCNTPKPGFQASQFIIFF